MGSPYRQIFDFSAPEPAPFEDGPLPPADRFAGTPAMAAIEAGLGTLLLERGYTRPHPQLYEDERGEPHVYVWFDISDGGQSYSERTFVYSPIKARMLTDMFRKHDYIDGNDGVNASYTSETALFGRPVHFSLLSPRRALHRAWGATGSDLATMPAQDLETTSEPKLGWWKRLLKGWFEPRPEPDRDPGPAYPEELAALPDFDETGPMRTDVFITHYTHWLVSPDPDATGRAHSRLWQTDTEPLFAGFRVDGLPAVHDFEKWETIGAEWEAHDMHAVLFRGQYGYGADGEQWTYEWADRSGMGNEAKKDPYCMLFGHCYQWKYRNNIPSDGVPADEIWATIARYLLSDGANIGAVFMLRTVAIMQETLGHGLISAQPNLDGGELEHGEEVGAMLLVAGGDAAEVFDAIEEALDPVPFSVERLAETGFPAPMAH